MATINGNNNANTLNGTATADTINANGGNDTVTAGGGNDTVDAGTGNDSVFGGQGNDTISGQAGLDTVYGGTGNDTIFGGDGNDVLEGGAATNPPVDLSLKWSAQGADEANVFGGFTQNTGGVNVGVSFTNDGIGTEWSLETSETQYVAAGEPFNANSMPLVLKTQSLMYVCFL